MSTIVSTRVISVGIGVFVASNGRFLTRLTPVSMRRGGLLCCGRGYHYTPRPNSI